MNGVLSPCVPQIEKLLERDPYLRPYEREIRRRYDVVGCFLTLQLAVLIISCSFLLVSRYGLFEKQRSDIDEAENGMDLFTRAYETFGIHFLEDNSVYCKEWAPGARQLYLYGDFSEFQFLK